VSLKFFDRGDRRRQKSGIGGCCGIGGGIGGGGFTSRVLRSTSHMTRAMWWGQTTEKGESSERSC